MKLYAPEYYKNFVCIADKCDHSCCIGWEIDIDDKALDKYGSSSHEYAKSILSSIDMEDTPHFRLCEGERCPHLDERGLCKIILNLGEDHLCHICREHPRFYNDTCHGREVGIGMACEEACRIILNSADYGVFEEIGEVCGEAEKIDFDAGICRKRLYDILSDGSLTYRQKLNKIYTEYGVSPCIMDDEEWKQIISSLEYLDDSHKSLFCEYSSRLYDINENGIYLERALAYFIFRHCTEAQDEEEFRISLGFCLFCERLLASVIKFSNANSLKDIISLARIISEEIEYSEDNTEEIMFQYRQII